MGDEPAKRGDLDLTGGNARRPKPFAAGPFMAAADVEEATPVTAGRPLIDVLSEAGLGAVGGVLSDERAALVNYVRAVLLFHSGSGGRWGHEEQGRYENLLGGQYPSHTRGLCDAGRDLLARIGEGV